MPQLKVFEMYRSLESLKYDYDTWVNSLTNEIEIKDVKLVERNGSFYMTIFYLKTYKG